MARGYLGRSTNGAMLTLTGFEELTSLLSQLEKKGLDEAAKKTFDEMTDILSNTLREKARESNVPQHLIDEIDEYKVSGANGGNHYFYSVGWRRKNADSFLKVCWLNYGTPHRYTQDEGQRIQLDGKWVTLGDMRGKIAPRYFISNTKRSVKAKFNAKMRKMQKEIFAEFKK